MANLALGSLPLTSSIIYFPVRNYICTIQKWVTLFYRISLLHVCPGIRWVTFGLTQAHFEYYRYYNYDIIISDYRVFVSDTHCKTWDKLLETIDEEAKVQHIAETHLPSWLCFGPERVMYFCNKSVQAFLHHQLFFCSCAEAMSTLYFSLPRGGGGGREWQGATMPNKSVLIHYH